MRSTAHRSRLRRGLVVAIAALGLLLASGLWSGHGYVRSHGHDHCDLCLHLGGTAPTPKAGTPVRAPFVQLATTGVVPDTPLNPSHTATAHRPRGPPLSSPSA